MIAKRAPKMLLAFLLCLLFISQSCLANSSLTPFHASPAVTPTLAANTQTPTGETQQGYISAWYIEDRSLDQYDDGPGLPILGVYADPLQWEECEALAEEVLSTLHVP